MLLPNRSKIATVELTPPVLICVPAGLQVLSDHWGFCSVQHFNHNGGYQGHK